VNDADGSREIGGAVVHAFCIGMLSESEWIASGFGSEKEGVEHVAPSAHRADDERDEDFAAVEEFPSDGIPSDKITCVVFGTLA
jgi:hypothetical protein